MIKKVAIQGIQGAFHEEAAVKYYKEDKIDLLTCKTFSELIESITEDKADTGIMAIENTLAGSILSNYSMIENSNLIISGEIYIRIVQNLLAKNGERIEDIRKVYSHPMAINQCSIFFKKYPEIELIESYDTAISAKDISMSNARNIGAIAGSFAAEKYDLRILAENIENDKLNYTRFFEIRKAHKTVPPRADKSSVCFNLPDKTGSLSSVLSVLAFYDINLHKIQSHPIIGKPWKYSFYTDLIFEDYNRYKQAIEAILPLTTNFKILGEYSEGNKSFSNIHKIRT